MTRREKELLGIANDMWGAMISANYKHVAERNELTWHMKNAIERFQYWKERYL